MLESPVSDQTDPQTTSPTSEEVAIAPDTDAAPSSEFSVIDDDELDGL